MALTLSGCAAWLPLAPEPLPPHAVHHRVRTADGWELALVEYPAEGPVRGRPVLLLHGIQANARNLDLDAEHSLARWLAARGRSAWTLALRGNGDSDRPDPKHGRPGDYTFDAYWRHDLPAALAYVRARTGGEPIDFVGHSMGGLVLYAYLAEGGEGLHAAVTLGSPTRLDWGLWYAPLIPTVRPLLDPTFVLGEPGPGVGSVPWSGEVSLAAMERMIVNPENVDVLTWRKLVAYAMGNVNGGVLHQLAPLVQEGRFVSADGALDFRADMARIRTPILVVAGKLDRLGMPMAVKDGYRALGGPKAWRLVGEETGARHDYGHMDLVIGAHAAEEVWTPALAFLDRPAGD